LNDFASLASRFRHCVDRDRMSGSLGQEWLAAWPSGELHKDVVPLYGEFSELDSFRDYVRNWNDSARAGRSRVRSIGASTSRPSTA
jgi:hypothetical protein